MDWSTYKALCDQPEYWSKWMLMACAELLSSSQDVRLREELIRAMQSSPLSKPQDHKGDDRTTMYRLDLPVDTRLAILSRIQTLQPDQKGFIAAWREYANCSRC